MNNIHIFLSAPVPTLGELRGMLINKSRFSELRAHMVTLFAGVEHLLDRKLLGVEFITDTRLPRLKRDPDEM